MKIYDSQVSINQVKLGRIHQFSSHFIYSLVAYLCFYFGDGKRTERKDFGVEVFQIICISLWCFALCQQLTDLGLVQTSISYPSDYTNSRDSLAGFIKAY